MKLGAAAQATSRTFLAEKRHVIVGLGPAGRVAAWPTSFFAMMATVESEPSACASRARCAAVSTSSGLVNRPVPATMKPRGTVMASSISSTATSISPSPCHDEAARHGDGEIDVAVLEIELALAEVLLAVPAAHVVVDGHARVPLRDLVQPALRELLAAHAI